MQNISYRNVRDKQDGTSVGYRQIGVFEALRSYGRNTVPILAGRAHLTTWEWLLDEFAKSQAKPIVMHIT